MSEPTAPGTYRYLCAWAEPRLVTVTEEPNPPTVEALTGQKTRLRGKMDQHQHGVLLSCFGEGTWERIEGETT